MSRMPYVVEKTDKGGERTWDLFSRLLKDRIIFISGAFDQDMADSIVAQLLYLESDSSERDIYMYINSPGGEVSAMYSIWDTMNYIRNDVVTVGLGTVASAASFILANGTKEKRYALPNTVIMLHELSTGSRGRITDLEIDLKHSLKLKEKMAEHYAKMTGQPVKKVLEDLQRDFYMEPEEAKEYGLIDSVQTGRGE